MRSPVGRAVGISLSRLGTIDGRRGPKDGLQVQLTGCTWYVLYWAIDIKEIRRMLSRTNRPSLAALVCLMLVPAPASAAIINWQYAGTVSANPTHYGGIDVGDAVTMTVAVDMAATDAYGSGSGAALE